MTFLSFVSVPRAARAVAMAENASLPGERAVLTRLDLRGLTAQAALGEGPAPILLGEAAARGRCTAPVRAALTSTGG